MSSFEHLQPKSISTPVARTSSFLRSSRQFAPMSTPASKQSLPNAQVEHADSFGYSFARIPLFASNETAEGRSVQRLNQTGIPMAVLQKMERSFGQDFSHVRVHANSSSPANLGALAYTQGRDMYFASGQFQPHTSYGQQILGHELTHVVQQMSGRVRYIQEKRAPINADPSLEYEADTVGVKAAQGESINMSGANPSSSSAQTTAPIQRMICIPGKLDIALSVALHNMQKRYPGEAVTFLQDADFSRMARNETLYILAHGSGDKVEHWTPSSLAHELIKRGLPTGTKIEVRACYSGSLVKSLGKDATFVSALAQEIKQQSNGRIAVYAEGFTGKAVVQEQGSHRAKDPSLVTPEKEEEYQKIIREGDPEIQAAEKYLKDALSKRVPLEEIAQRVAELTKKTFEKLYAHNLTVLKSIEMGVSSSSLARYLEMMDPAFETNNRLLAEIRAREAKEWHPQSPSYKPASYIA